MEPRTHWILSDVRLRVLEWPGEKGTILALHGLTGYAETFLPLIPALHPPYRVLSMDLRGRGESEQPADERAYGLQAHLRDIAAVLDALAPEGALLMGHSLGAMLALALAAERPDLARGLLLFDGGPLPSRAFSESLNQVLNARLEELPSLEAFRELVRAMPFLQPFDERLMPVLEAGLIREPDGRVRVKFPSRLGALEAMELGAIWNERLRAYAGRIRCPVLLLKAPVGALGPHDRFFTEEEERLLREVVPQVRIVEVPGTTHYTIVVGYHPERDRLARAFAEEVLG
ncbi:alpha/beta fold hydrolase [Thermoflexus sp.]|nr:alpha/beta hydrolase [Thermoflexus sp.]MCS7352133.1 alpha/beta hydrolase [Thermoflexus sp.]MCX7689197.1 alpha/beta hydrolase [Thermoflexus sp.]MDW8181592.1 alpha/beta hydrolase [Anaerolineae bacterium]MDW8184957.1 alpha/beta hydrolase [Anaerolineae bacterium]